MKRGGEVEATELYKEIAIRLRKEKAKERLEEVRRREIRRENEVIMNELNK
jgi:hypothetical protein